MEIDPPDLPLDEEVEVLNPTPREKLYKLIRLFLDGQLEAGAFAGMFQRVARHEVDPDTLSAAERQAFTELIQAIQRAPVNGWPEPYVSGDLGPAGYVELQAAVLRALDALHPGLQPGKSRVDGPT